jgi:hypothetical protein
MYNAKQGREVVGRRLLSEKVVSRGGNCGSSRWNTTGGKSLASRYDEAKGSAPESTGRGDLGCRRDAKRSHFCPELIPLAAKDDAVDYSVCKSMLYCQDVFEWCSYLNTIPTTPP